MTCLNTNGKYGKVTDTELKGSNISKSVTIIIFAEFTDQLINYSINCASLSCSVEADIFCDKKMNEIKKIVLLFILPLKAIKCQALFFVKNIIN